MSRKVPEERYRKTFSYKFRCWLEGTKDPFLGQAEMDRMRNVYIRRQENRGDRPVVQLDAHSDEVGFMVQAIRPNGTLRIAPLGGWVSHNVPAHRFWVRNREGAYIPGITASTPPHFLSAEARRAPLEIADITVDVGATSREEAVEVFGVRIGEPVVPDFEIPYHTDIMKRFDGIDLDAAGKVAGNGFYYLMGDIARLHSAVISYARDFMIDRGFTYCVPPFMIRSNVVTGVMSFAEMDAMMYKIEGEDLYLIGTSEHSMIGKFIDTILQPDQLPQTLTSYSPCFRKEKGAHGLEERGVYRLHQFEKQAMIVVCQPEESPMWFDKLWQNTVDLFRSLDIPVRTLECCSGDLADLKVKSVDVEAWSPRQKKYFEVGSCSNLGDAQARRLKIRVNGEKGKYFAHTLNNTVVAPPRMLIAFLENNLNEDGTINIPEALRPYMGGMEKIQ